MTNESTIAEDLAPTIATTTFNRDTVWYQETSQLKSRVGQASKDTGSCYQCARHTYAGLKPNAYDRLVVQRPETFFKPGATQPKTETPGPLVVDGLLQTIIEENSRQTGWAPPVVSNPDCKATGKCPPLVCAAGHCNHSYAVVFAAKNCRHCPKMWPVIEKLRKRGYIVYYIETNKHPGVVKQFDLKVAPTTIVFDKDKQVARFNGVVTAANISKHMKTQAEQGLKKNEPR
ncbi:MAG: thioredoxin family protein [Candidatus Thorarchaeota archaeon]